MPLQSSEGLWCTHKFQCTPKGSLAKPLFSIGQECDNESFVVFSRHGGAIINERTKQMRRFPRLPNGAYEIEMWLPPLKLVEEAGFRRQG